MEKRMPDLSDTGISELVISEIREFAKQYGVAKVILFGSRARGDFHRTSDIDLAVSGGRFSPFALDVDEETGTLLEFDIINLDGMMEQAFRETIQREGRILYERV